ncbi:hypothetical protein Tco_1287156 [Tanacetum coccineum]
MPIWKDASYFDSPSKDVGNGEPKSAADDQKQVEDGLDNENDEKDKFEDDSSTKEVNTARQHVNTASPEVNTGHFKLNTVDPLVNTASSYDPDCPKDMFKMEASHTLEATHVWILVDLPIEKEGHWNKKWGLQENKKDDEGLRLGIKQELRFKDLTIRQSLQGGQVLYGLHQAPRACISSIMKSMGKTNLPIPTSTFSAIPFGYFTVLSANSTVNLM